MKKPLLLITNDDGYTAPGITLLATIAETFGEVVVIAPDAPQSAQSNALTVATPLRLNLVEERENFKLYKTNGKPTDCVKLAHNQILQRKPDLLLSGINHGSNASVNVVYSGTMGAVIEGAILGIPSIGFSIDNHSWNADFSHCKTHIHTIIAEVLENGLPSGVCLNVNFPEKDTKGVKVCRQSSGYWHKEYQKNIDPKGQEYYWLTGEYVNTEAEATDTDVWAVANGYASIVPTTYDLTASEFVTKWQEKF